MSAADHLSPQQFRTVFHGTSEDRVGSIREHGLTPGGGANPASYYMVTSNAGIAGHYARRGDPALLTYKIPESQASEYLHEPLHYRDADYYALKQPLPGHMIAHADAGSSMR